MEAEIDDKMPSILVRSSHVANRLSRKIAAKTRIAAMAISVLSIQDASWRGLSKACVSRSRMPAGWSDGTPSFHATAATSAK